MSKHEEKICPRCQALFECKSGDIGQCQCYGISFSDEESSFLGRRYNDCLCRSCLTALKSPDNMFKEKFFKAR